MTDEILDLTIKNNGKYLGITREEFVEAINNDVSIKGFVGWIEMSSTDLDEFVPEGFENRLKEDDSVKTFREFINGNIVESVNEGKVIIPIGYTDEDGNIVHVVNDNELRTWVEHFGIDNCYTASSGTILIKRE